ncbi:SDR family oxidoreductase [Streptomyces sp. NPDC007851]|uniref:type I polyketide synthase n=1 Tax=Streptomyces sp. NPDC007851 TaxID=3155008 RepID=UPI0033F74710
MDDQREPGMDIAVIGLSCAYPGAGDSETFWNNIVSGVDCLTDLTEDDLVAAGEDADLIRAPEYVRRAACIDDIDLFDAEFFGLTPREAELMDPQHRLFIEHCWRAVETAGYDPRRLPGPVGVYAGQGANTYIENVRSRVDRQALRKTGGRWESVGSLENDVDYLTPKVSYHLNLTGPSVPVSTACSTSLVAVHLACQSLRTYECDAALAGGVCVSPPVRRGYYYIEGGIASADGRTRSFDSRSTGTVFGSGVGVVMLKRLEDALVDGDIIQGVIAGSAINNDGAGRAGFTAPSVDGQAELIAAAQAVAGIHPETITYLEAHGTGTPIGDPIELAALTRAFREQTDKQGYCVLGSVKANIGHTDSAAGIAGLIKALHAAKLGVIPPQLNFREPNQALNLSTSPFRIVTEREQWRTPDGVPRRAGVSSFGIGGTNAHVVVEQPPADERPDEPAGWHVLPLSARGDDALAQVLTRLADHLEGGSARLDDTAYTLQTGRTEFARRAAVVARTPSDAARALRERANRTFTEAANSATVAFLFPGQGAHYPGMARGLYEGVPEFAEVFDHCAELFLPLIGQDLRDIVLREITPQLLDSTRYIQPALFSVEYALARALMARGVRPAGMLGHSMGEFVAATVAGVFGIEDAVRVIDARARFMQDAPAGAMLAVPMAEADVTPLLPDGVTVAADNGPRLVAVAGDREALQALSRTLAERGLTCRELRVPHAAHTAAMDEAAARFSTFMETVPVQAPTIPYISNVTGTWITDAEVRSPAYWGAHMREPVRFRAGLADLLKTVDGPLIEVGPGHGLLSLARGSVPTESSDRLVRTLRSRNDADDDLGVLYEALAALWEQGTELSWAAFARGGERRTQLPTYPFQRKRFWIDEAAAPEQPARREIARVRDPQRWLYSPAWRSCALPQRQPTPGADQPAAVVVGSGPLADAVTGRLMATGRQVTAVVPGAALQRDLELALTGRPRATVVFTTEAGGTGADGDAPADLLATARTLAGQGAGRFDLLVAVHGVFDVVGDEGIRPEPAILTGIAKVIPKELRHVSCRVVDLDPAEKAEAAAGRLIAELDAVSPKLVVALRGGRRWSQEVEQLQPAAVLAEQLPLRDKGVYLITGGLGGIGLSLGHFLAERYGARLVLSGRTALPPRADWDDWMTVHGPADGVSRQLRRIRDIEEAGGEVAVLPCDVTDPAAVHELVRAARERFGALDGVVHAAGLTGGGGLIETLDPAEFHRTIAPKVVGARALIEATADAGLGFLALFSSLTTVDSWDGAADYTAGNAFLDALAHESRRRGRKEVLAIDWTGWLDTGMNAGEDNAADQAPGDDPGIYLTEPEGHQTFLGVLATGLPQVHVSVGDLHDVVEQAERFARAGSAPETTPEETPAAPANDQGHGRPAAVGDFVAATTRTEEHLCEIFQQVLGFDSIGCDDNFFTLGGNSLLALDLVGQVRRHYSVQILLRDFFSRPTVHGLAALVGAEAVGEAAGEVAEVTS